MKSRDESLSTSSKWDESCTQKRLTKKKTMQKEKDQEHTEKIWISSRKPSQPIILIFYFHCTSLKTFPFVIYKKQIENGQHHSGQNIHKRHSNNNPALCGNASWLIQVTDEDTIEFKHLHSQPNWIRTAITVELLTTQKNPQRRHTKHSWRGLQSC
jgi:hypothetical protein